MGFRSFIKKAAKESTGIGLSESERKKLREKKLESLKFRSQIEAEKLKIQKARLQREKLKPNKSFFLDDGDFLKTKRRKKERKKQDPFNIFKGF